MAEIISRSDAYHAFLVGDITDLSSLPLPVSREDMYLYRLCELKANDTGSSGGGSGTAGATEELVTRYGVRFGGSANSGSTVQRLYNAVGLVAGVGTDTDAAENNFDNIYPWSDIRRCCGYWGDDGNFVVNAYKGEPGYAVDGSRTC